MNKTSKQFLGDLGTLKGDVEVAIFKQLRDRSVSKTEVSGTVVAIDTDDRGFKTVFVNSVPAQKCSLEELIDILEQLEQNRSDA